jgi:hypothetical protein
MQMLDQTLKGIHSKCCPKDVDVDGLLCYETNKTNLFVVDAMHPYLHLLCGRSAGFGVIAPPPLEIA